MSRYAGKSWAAFMAETRAKYENTPAPERNLSPNAPHGGSTPGNQETRSLESLPTTQEALIESYKPEKSKVDPETAILLERYVDIIGIVDNHPAFQKAVNAWNVYPQALTDACKLYGVAVVLDAIRYTANYKAAKAPGKFLFAVLRNGKQPRHKAREHA